MRSMVSGSRRGTRLTLGIGLTCGAPALCAAPSAASAAGGYYGLGDDTHGSLANGGDTTVTVATPLPALAGFSSAALGFGTGVGVSGGHAFAWGTNGYGLLGDDDGNLNDTSYSPVEVSAVGGVGTLSGITAVASGAFTDFALSTGTSSRGATAMTVSPETQARRMIKRRRSRSRASEAPASSRV
jgi:hypothetical protein